jgi:DNA-binding NarL/FixJ family response regulator
MPGALICDGQLLFAEALGRVLARRGVESTAIAGLDDALSILTATPITRVVLGVDRTDASSEDAIRRIREWCPDSWLVCVGADHNRRRVASYYAAGADLVLSKERPLRELVDGVLARPALAYSGHGGYVAVGSLDTSRRPAHEPLAAHFLTNRERDVLRLLVLGASTRRISVSLGISSVTARGYVQDAMTKLGVHSRLEAVRYAMLHSVV